MPFFILNRDNRTEPHPINKPLLTWQTVLFVSEHGNPYVQALIDGGFQPVTEQQAVNAAHARGGSITRISKNAQGRGADGHDVAIVKLEAAGLPRLDPKFADMLTVALANSRVREVLRAAVAGHAHPDHPSLFQHSDESTAAVDEATVPVDLRYPPATVEAV